MTDDVYERIAALVHEGMTVVVVEQLLKRTLSGADEVVLLKAGQLVAAGNAYEVKVAARRESEYFDELELASAAETG